ncbi:MAG: DUF4363 family protein [Firmicutes bacterium]|nr:DUF4363 family protein [Bacillota bacterium]
MMKRGIIILVLFAAMLGLLVWLQIYMSDTMNTMLYKTEMLEKALAEEDYELSLALCKELEAYWERQEAVLAMFIEHNEIEDIGKQLRYTLAHIEKGDLPVALIECKMLAHRIIMGLYLFNFDLQNII